MAVCTWCEQEMTSADSCAVSELHRAGVAVAMIRYGDERGWGSSPRCGDCGVHRGGFHHLGCDIQRCPVCGGQMMSCGCRFDEDEHDAGTNFDVNGHPMEVVEVDGRPLVVHYADLPDKDVTEIDGIPVTTALRTVIDVALDLDPPELERIVGDCLERRLFTTEHAWARLAEDDMRSHPGATRLREVIAEMPPREPGSGRASGS